jgi:hypothetical protein
MVLIGSFTSSPRRMPHHTCPNLGKASFGSGLPPATIEHVLGRISPIGEYIRFIKAYVSNQNPGYAKAVEIFSQSFSVTPSLRATEYQLAVKYSSI